MIGIVILNYNSYPDTIKLVQELQKQTVAHELYIVVVDNNSPNNSYLELKSLDKHFTNVVVLQTGENLGYAKGNNFGLQYLDKKIHPQYVAILNNDVILENDCLEKLALRYTKLERPAFIAPKQLDLFKNEVLPGKLNTYLDDCLSLFFVFKLIYKHSALKFTDNTGNLAMKIDLITGSFMFTSFEIFRKMDFFFPGTFLFVEERFIAEKAKQLKLYNYIVLDQSYIHAHSKTINTEFTNIAKYKLLFKGRAIYMRYYLKFGAYKAPFYLFLSKLSLLELYVINLLATFTKKK